MTIPNLLEILFIAILLCAVFAFLTRFRRDMSLTFWKLSGGAGAGAVLLFACFGHTGCTTTQRQAVASALSTPQAKALTASGEVIAQAALAVYAPQFAWTIPLAVNAASGLPALLNATSTAQAASVVQDTVNQVANIPAYKPVADQINNALKVVNPKTPQERVAATQALAQAISEHLPK